MPNKYFQQCSRIENQHTKVSSFIYTNHEYAEKEIREATPFIGASRKLNT
jgi:hypothetical protein